MKQVASHFIAVIAAHSRDFMSFPRLLVIPAQAGIQKFVFLRQKQLFPKRIQLNERL